MTQATFDEMDPILGNRANVRPPLTINVYNTGYADLDAAPLQDNDEITVIQEDDTMPKVLNEAKRSVNPPLIRMSSSNSSNKNGRTTRKLRQLSMRRTWLRGKNIWISWKGTQKLLALSQSHSKSWRKGGISLLELQSSKLEFIIN